MSHFLTQESWLARAFYTSGSKKVVCSCLQDLDLPFEWHMDFSALFIRTTAKHTAWVREWRAFSDAVKELSKMSARTGDLVKQMFQNLYGDHKNS